MKARVIGLGSYLPKKILSNRDLEKMVDTSDEWIVTRSGISERRIADKDEYSSTMGIEASKRALADAAIGAEELDLVIVASLTPDYIFPSTACLIQDAIGAKNAAAFDMQAACSGYIYCLAMAKAFIESGTYKNILIVATEKLSTIVDYQDRSTCVLFGDGAAAAVVSANKKGLLIKGVVLGSDGKEANLLVQPAGGCRRPASEESVKNREHFIKMDGKVLYKHAVRRMEKAAEDVLSKSGLKEEDINWLIPHQANLRIIESLSKRFAAIPTEKVVSSVIKKYGNTSASSIGIALDELKGRINPHENILLVAFGAGLTWASAILSREEC